MANINKERGMQLFESKIAKVLSANNLSGVNSSIEKLILLRNYYSDQVGVMPVNGLYSAAVMAEACIKASQTETSDNHLVKAALQFYESKNSQPPSASTSDLNKIEKNLKKEETRNTALDQQTRLLNSEIEKNYNEQTAASGVVVDKNSNLINGRTSQMEVIDMIHDWSLRRSATTEGKRSLGLIPANFDASNEVEPEVTMEEPKMALIEENKDGLMEILCPDCHEDTIYPISPDTFSCFNCNNTFYADINLNDLSEGDSEEDLSELPSIENLWTGLNTTKRTNGKIQNRGKIEEKDSD